MFALPSTIFDNKRNVVVVCPLFQCFLFTSMLTSNQDRMDGVQVLLLVVVVGGGSSGWGVTLRYLIDLVWLDAWMDGDDHE